MLLLTTLENSLYTWHVIGKYSIVCMRKNVKSQTLEVYNFQNNDLRKLFFASLF